MHVVKENVFYINNYFTNETFTDIQTDWIDVSNQIQ